MSIFNSTIDYLLHRRDPMEVEFARSLSRLKSSSDLDQLSVISGDSGGVSKFVHMEAESGMQMVSKNNYQKAATYMQLQEEGVKYANILYAEMAALALKATDPYISQTERDVLSSQFNELREIALDLNHATFADNYLFEERASTTDFVEQAKWDLDFKRIDDTILFDGTSIVPKNLVVPQNFVGEKLYNSPYTTAPSSDVKTGTKSIFDEFGNEREATYAEITRDVIYNKGNVVVHFNPGNRGERLQILQGNPDGEHRILLDTFEWKTRGEAYNHNFDTISFSYSPDEEPDPVLGFVKNGNHVPYFLNGGHGPLSAQKDSDNRGLWNANGRNGANTDGTAKNQLGYDLWQNTAYDWVEDESARYGLELKEAILSSTEINPALRTPLDLYKLSGAGNSGEDQNANFNVGERNAMYQLGGLQFIAKHPDAQTDPPEWVDTENYRIGAGVSHNGNIYRATTDNIGVAPGTPGTGADWEQITDDFDFEFANDYKFTVEKSLDLQDEQQAKVNLGYWENGDFKSQLVFEVKDTSGLQGFESNKAILEFEENEYYIQQSDREDKTWDEFGENSGLNFSDNELWLQEKATTAETETEESTTPPTTTILTAGGAKAAQVTIGGVSAWVAMTDSNREIRDDFINPSTNILEAQSIKGTVGNTYSIEVIDDGPLGGSVSGSGTNLTIALDLLQNANDKATIISKVGDIQRHSTEVAIGTTDAELYSEDSIFTRFHKAGDNAKAGDAVVSASRYTGALGNGAEYEIVWGADYIDDPSLTDDDKAEAREKAIKAARTPTRTFENWGSENPKVTLTYTYSKKDYEDEDIDPIFTNRIFSGLNIESPTTGTASGGTSQIYMHSQGHIAEKINEHFKNNRNDSPFRNATAAKDQPFKLDTGETQTASGGVDEVLIKYEEETIKAGQDEYIGKFSTSRLLTQEKGSVDKHDPGDDHFDGYTLEHIKKAFEKETSNIFVDKSNPSNRTDLLDKRGGSGVFSNPTGTQVTGKLGEYSAYSTKLTGESEATVHIIDNNLAGNDHEGLNAWMGRDEETATYEENVIDKEITIKVKYDNTDPRDIADAYIAYINRFTLDEAESRTDLSAFMAPVVLNNAQKITPGVYQGDDVEDTIGRNSVTDYESDGSSADWVRNQEKNKFETEKSSEHIAMSNNLTVRVYQGEREMGTDSGRPEDEEDSFQVRLFYTPPDEEELETVGRESDLNVPIYALGLGLLRDDTKAEFDIGDLHMEAESRGEYTLYIKTKSADGFRDYSYNYNMYLDIDSFGRSLGDISSIIDASTGNEDPDNDTSQGRFTASGEGNLEIEKIFWEAGNLRLNGTVNDPSDPTNADYSFAIKSSVVNPDKNHLDVELVGDTLTVYVNNATSTTVSSIGTAITNFSGSVDNTSGITFTTSGNGNLGLSGSASGDFYEDGATAMFTSTTGYHGEPLSIADAESAQRAFENMAREISDLGGQVDQLAQNMSKINMSDDHVSRQLAIRKDMGSELSDEVLQSETLKIQQFEILRDYHISLLHKVMRVNEDMVRMLVLK